MLDPRAPVLPAWPHLATPHAYGGRIQAQGELAIPLNEGCVFIVDGSATVRSITPHPPGVVVTLFFTGAATFVHSAKLLIPGAANVAFAPGETDQLFSLGDGKWVVLAPQPGALRYDIPQSLSDAQQAQARANASAALKGHIFGLTLKNDVTFDGNNYIVVEGGEAASTEANPVLMVLSSNIIKRLNASWTVGDNVGGLDTGSEAVSTWYHVWLIRRSDTGVVDVLLSASAT